jgi:hypothetical protein
MKSQVNMTWNEMHRHHTINFLKKNFFGSWNHKSFFVMACCDKITCHDYFFNLKFSNLSTERFCHHLPWCIYDCILHLFKIPLCTHPSRFEPKTSRKCTKVLTSVGWVSQFYVTHWVEFSQNNLQKGPVFPKLKNNNFFVRQRYQHFKNKL